MLFTTGPGRLCHIPWNFNVRPLLTSRFSTTPKYFQVNKIPFDTKKFNDDLMSNDFNEKQSEAIIRIVSQSMGKGIKTITNDFISKETLSTVSYKQKVDFVKLKGELQSLDTSEFTKMNNEYERVKLELEKLRQKIREEISKSQAGVRLDLSLEKGRLKEESSMHHLHIKETDTRIDQEISNMKMQIDSMKTQVMQWLIGVCTGTFALILAYVRLVV
ncbi:Fmp32 protein [Saccharomycopsis crataegensis]|uniref:Fmp32 protein n=1 Tax=Saccharomycopsis crataegensis TaxID=43959 RepID=A0AAV5QIW2_9ASCO|nr:Fmp32 protein [Saccharomycopsis crataegensis]